MSLGIYTYAHLVDDDKRQALSVTAYVVDGTRPQSGVRVGGAGSAFSLLLDPADAADLGFRLIEQAAAAEGLAEQARAELLDLAQADGPVTS